MTNLGLSNNVNLSWDDYIGFSYPSYIIDRFHTSTGWQTIATLPSNLNSYTDNFAPNGNVIYSVWVDAPFCDPTRVGVNTSRSNIKNQGIANGIEELNYESLSVYPNPAHELITIFGNTESITFIEIVDITGKVISTINNPSTQINVSALANGTYMIHIQNKNHDIWKKLEVVR